MNHSTSSAANMQILVEDFNEDGEIVSDETARSLSLHLRAVSHYEENEQGAKVIKQMESFKRLLDYQQENEWISETAYQTLQSGADYVMGKWG